jgi:hypothetical protein
MPALLRRWWPVRRGIRNSAAGPAGWMDCCPSPVWEIGLAIALVGLGACAAEMLPDRDGGEANATQTVASADTATPPVAAMTLMPADDAGRARASTTYYVRPDGGNATQCDGRADAPYPGDGTDQACAWKHPFFALPPGGAPRIAGGDTLLIGRGDYRMGDGAPGARDCSGASCYMAPIPSGPSAAAPTRIIGKPGARPVLWGAEGAKRILNLDGSSNVEVGHLEITDRSDCVSSHGDFVVACRPSAPHGDWARVGLRASGSRNVRLHDLDIHGLAHTGINAGGLADWTIENVRLYANGRAGWDGNVGKGASSNSGRMVLRNVEIAWNGCGERWKTGEPWACWAQKTGGYGDGLGTTYTGGQWLLEDVFVHHNTSDGLDLRYMDGEPSTSVTVRRLYATGNAGNQLKIRGNATVEDSVLVGRCGFFRTRRDHMTDGDHCRAGGNTLQLVLTPDDRVVVRSNTITGEGGVLIGANEGDDSARITLRNNVLIGFPTFRKPGVRSAPYYANKAPADVSWDDNLVWQVKNGACPGDSVCNRDPRLAGMTLGAFDATPLAGSPLADGIGAPSRVARALQQRMRASERGTTGARGGSPATR